MKVMVVVATLAISGVAFAQSTEGPRGRAEEEEALKRLPPAEELKVRVWAAEHPEAARRARGRPINRDPQAAMSEELDTELHKLSPEQRKELGSDIEVPAR